jgi:NAD(P)-dependent dehydrogenase (short-subunit alcohol dehydrogenase family)
MKRLTGKVALVTGASRGLGAASAAALAQEGARVLLTDVLDLLGEATSAALNQQGHDTFFLHHDVADEQQWEAVLDAAVARYGHIDIVVNNAGINLPKTIEDLSTDEFRRVVEVNLIGCFLGTQRAIRRMKQTGGGSIINIASNSTQNVVPLTAAYSPSKAAIANLTKVAAVHCAAQRYNIRVNSVHPGPIETDMLTGGVARAADIPQVKQLIDAIPMGRMGRPSEIGEVVAFLASDAASFMTASEVFVDGGLTVSMMK